MPVPNFQSFFLPSLKSFASGGELPMTKVREHVAASLGLSEQDIRELLPRGTQTVFVNRVSWAVIYMERAGLLERVRRGVYQLSNDGKELLATNPVCIDKSMLGEYPKFVECSKKKNEPPPTCISNVLVLVKRQRDASDAVIGNRVRPATGTKDLEGDALRRVRNLSIAAEKFLEAGLVAQFVDCDAQPWRSRRRWVR